MLGVMEIGSEIYKHSVTITLPKLWTFSIQICLKALYYIRIFRGVLAGCGFAW